jgi:tetratricopeptide (TPR) repeat protein
LKLRQFIPVLIVAAGIWAYHNSFQGPFIFDDGPSILENPHIRHLWPITEPMVTSPKLAVQGRPVECLTLALNYAWGGLNVRGYHAVNLMLHLACALVLFGLLRRTFESETLRDRFGTAAPWLAAAIALIWEVHPLQTESVTYIVQRSELLMGLFLLLTLYGTLRGSQSPRPWVWYLAAVVSCALGMGSKEVMVGAPLIVLLYDRVFLAPSFRQLWQRRMGLYVGLGATWLLLAALVAGTVHPMTSVGIEGLTPWDYLKTEAGVIIYYLRLCFWPHPLVIDYFDWPITRSLKDAVLPGLVVLGLLGTTVWAFRRRPWLSFLGAWFFLILAPTSSILPSVGEMAAERRMYLPLAAVITLVVVGAFTLGRRLWNKPQGAALGCVATASVVGLFTFLTIQRNRDYRSALAIWQDAAEKRPGNARAHSNLGAILEDAGRVQEAIGQVEQALRLRPGYADAHYNLGHALARLGQVQEAMAQYEQALRLKPDYAEAHNNLGNILDDLDRPEEAVGHYEQALRINPDLADAHYNWGIALVQLGRLPEAVGHYEQALRIRPDYVEAHNNLGVALIRLGRLPEAMEHWQQALRINPDLPQAHYNMGLTLVRLGRVPEAIEHYQQALRIKPDMADAHYNWGLALEKLGRTQEAIAHYEQALRIQPDFVRARDSLARARVVQ